MKTVDNRLDIDPDAADTVRLIFTLASEGKSVSEISRELYEQKLLKPSEYKRRKRGVTPNIDYGCVWEGSAIRKILSDEQYMGTYIAGKSVTETVGSKATKMKPKSEWIRIPGHHPAIVSGELFGKVQAIINAKGESKRGRRPKTSERYAAVRQSPLKGKVVCGACGHVMTLSATKNAAFECKFTRAAPDAECHGLRVPSVELENTLFEVISKHAQIALGVDSLSEVNAATLEVAKQAECRQSIERLGDEKCNLYEQYVVRAIDADEYKSRKVELDGEIERLNRAYAILTEQISQRQCEAETCAILHDAVSGNGGLSRSVVDALIDKVWVYPNRRTDILWKIAGM